MKKVSALHLCPKLMSVAVNGIDIQDTLQLLEIAKKLKVKKFGLNTYNDPDLLKVHNGWPFNAYGSIFSTVQEVKRPNMLWKENATAALCYLLEESFESCSGGGAGNYMQNQLPTEGNDKKLNYVTGIYTLSEDKQSYDFIFISKENAEVKRNNN